MPIAQNRFTTVLNTKMKKPVRQLRIPVHVFAYSLAVSPVVLYALYYQQNKPSDEEFEDVLKRKYGDEVEASRVKREQMVKFVEAIKLGQVDERMDEMLREGKGKMKRQFAVDEKYYGTEEGLAAKERIQNELQLERTKKERAKAANDPPALPPQVDSDTVNAMSATTKSALAAAALGSVAAVAAILVGSWRSG